LYLTKASRPVRALTFEYSGIAERELESARAVADRAGLLEHRFVRLPDLKEAGDMPGFSLRSRPPTYIPLRNSIFYSFAASYAEETGAACIVGGHNQDDQELFEDVSSRFFLALEKALWAGSPVLRENRLRILRPLSRKRKPEVIRLAAEMGVPLELTWSCHRDKKEHCWSCDGCASRSRSFQEAGIEDPLSAARRGKIT
jgi:7-cyano-7-deazaguanine synthase